MILKDAIGVWILLTACLLAGVIINEIRPNPLPLVYSPPEARLHETVDRLGHPSHSPIALEGDVSLDEMREISATRAVLILDARPEVFYRLGHIPSAINLPRDDFENQYRAVEWVLRSSRDKVVVVYCSGSECQDSRMVGDALARLGYSHVRLFRGGWSDWESGNQPEERQ